MNSQRQLVVLVCAFICWPALRGSAEPACLEPVKTIELKGGGAGKFDHLALNAGLSHLYVADKSNNTLDIVDLKAGSVLKIVPDQKKISGVAFAADCNLLAVGNGEGLSNIFATPGYKRAYSLKLKEADNVKYCAKTKRFYIEHAEKKLSVVDPDTGRVTGSIDLPGDPEGFVIDRAGAKLYICSLPEKDDQATPDKIAVVDLQKNSVVAKYPLALAKKITAIDIDEEGGRLFVGCREKPMVVVLDAKTGKELTSVEIPGDIDDLFWDAKRKRIYAVCGEGAVAVIEQKDKDNYQTIEKVNTGNQARTGLFDPETGRLYVAVPRRGPAAGPEVRIFQAKP